jgi:hypothetical protein
VNLVAVLVTANHAAMRLVQIVHRRVMAVLSLARKPVVLAMSAPLVLLLVKSIVRAANTVASRLSPAHLPNRLPTHVRQAVQPVVRPMVRSHVPIANRVSKPNFYEMTLMKALLMERFLFFADG